ncbi:hypothetical protein AYO43_02850 [Nitrospira sp. SCGC AG-212-E16]|nr:hypothetical protein AYO43_02850 [Nitrospira sp. SCGC AG-212-E16]
MRQCGYFSKTFVSTYYAAIGERQDFDLYRQEIFAVYRWMNRNLIAVIEPYLSFVYLIFRFDIFHFFYDGGVLARTPLRFVELQLLHAFRKKVVVMPYGADVHVLPFMRNSVYRFGQLYHYGANLLRERHTIERWIDYFSRHADCCIGSINFDALYRWDILPVSYLTINVDLFQPSGDYEYKNDGRTGTVVIAHTPNHRVIKGTEYIIAAIERLRSEGYQIEFLLLEKMKNTEVRKILERCDILVELLVTGYGLSGIEGMALAKPVISNFQGDTAVLRYYSFFNECPIVQADIDTVYEKLKWLVDNPDLRKSIGHAGRSYVEKYHSYFGHQLVWEQIYKKIWYGADVDLMLFYHPLCGEFTKLYNARLASRS